MRSDIFPLSFLSAIKTLIFIAGAALLQGCFFGGGHHTKLRFSRSVLILQL